MLSLPQRVAARLERMNQGHIRNREQYLPYVQGRKGLEIGGPSAVFQRDNPIDLYQVIGNLDNCDFSKSTVWAQQQEEYIFDPAGNPGKSIFCDGSDLHCVEDSSYDFVLSSHNLEHFANPVKALKEWKRVLRPSGALIVALPNYRRTFDHRRTPTRVDHMLEDFERNTGEDDLTHLSEILEKHDLSMDLAAGSFEKFKARSLDNLSFRCLHHHVFDQHNSRELLDRTGFDVHCIDLAYPCHICILATSRAS